MAEHLSERYRQFFIIALGELILVTGITFSRSELDASRAAAFVTAFAITVLLWRIYLYRAGELLPAAIAGARLPGRLALWVSIAHLLMVIGIVAVSAGFELVIRHPLGHTDAAWAAVILGGPALYLVGRGLFEYGLFGRVARSRLIGAAVLGAWAAVAVHTPPLAVTVAAAVVLLGVSIADAVRTRARPPEVSTG